MAKDDMRRILYVILSELYEAKKKGEKIDLCLISPSKFHIADSYWLDIIIEAQEKGLGNITRQKRWVVQRYKTKPLGNGTFKGIPYEKGGGYRAHFGGDGILQYHPSGGRHHDGKSYYKISTGEFGKKRYDMKGNEKNG